MAESTTNFTWRVTQLERETADGYVFAASYLIIARDDAYSATAQGVAKFERPEAELIPFADLTEDLVVSWTKDYLGEEKVQEVLTALQVNLDEQRSPTRALGLPWPKDPQPGNPDGNGGE